jgi:hypothetical protein
VMTEEKKMKPPKYKHDLGILHRFWASIKFAKLLY